jgi:hypothetical protein
MKNKSKNISGLESIFSYLHDNIQSINNSKIFAGLMIITLNVASKFVNIKLGKTMESYLKHTFSRQILVFAIAWMGTRDIYIALVITLLFTIFMDYLFHEDSEYFVLSEEFRDHHISLLEENETVSDEDIKKANEVLEKAKKQKNNDNPNSNNTPIYEGYQIR